MVGSKVKVGEFVSLELGVGFYSTKRLFIGYLPVVHFPESGLVELSTQLAADLKITAEFLCTRNLPEGYEEVDGIGGKDLLVPKATTSGGANIDTTPIYDGLDLDEAYLFFAYPWPGQEEFMMALFQAIASEDAILLIHHADCTTVQFPTVRLPDIRRFGI